jgi:hypothetical protein
VITVTVQCSGFSAEERLLKLIDESEIEIAPYEIAKKAHVKRSSDVHAKDSNGVDYVIEVNYAR